MSAQAPPDERATAAETPQEAPGAGVQPADGQEAPEAHTHAPAAAEGAQGAGDEDELDDVDELGAGDEAARREAQALMEEQGRKLDQLERHIGRKLAEIFGQQEADSLEVCELCSWTRTFGWRVDQLPPEPVREAVKLAIGLGTIAELKTYPAFATCQACDGYCRVLTGAKAGTEMWRQCPACKGRGYSSSLPEDNDRPAAGTPVVAEAIADGQPPQLPDRDTYGTPLGHPDYGKMPQFREVPIAHWQQATTPAP